MNETISNYRTRIWYRMTDGKVERTHRLSAAELRVIAKIREVLAEHRACVRRKGKPCQCKWRWQHFVG